MIKKLATKEEEITQKHRIDAPTTTLPKCQKHISEAFSNKVINRRVLQRIDTNMPMFMNDVENLTVTQIAMLRAVADGEYQFNAMAIVKKYELGSAQTITRNKKILVERDFVEKDNKNYRFSDPVFELLFRREYM